MSFDKNKDGKVTKDELPERMHHLIALGDTNKDGALDREEIKKLAERLNQGARPRGPGGPGGPPPGPGRLERIIDDLGLNTKDKEKADKVLEAHHEEVRKQWEKANEELLKELKGVLSAEQLAQLKEDLMRRPPPPRPRRPGE